MMQKILRFGQRTWQRIRRIVRRRRLVFALSFAIVAALALTILSVTIYNVGGFYRYDLSRPGFEKERQEIAKTPTDVTYDTTSPIDKKALDAFLGQLDKHHKNLDSYNFFNDGNLSDEALQLTPGTSVAPQ